MMTGKNNKLGHSVLTFIVYYRGYRTKIQACTENEAKRKGLKYYNKQKFFNKKVKEWELTIIKI